MPYTILWQKAAEKGRVTLKTEVFPSRGKAAKALPKSGRVYVERDEVGRIYKVVQP